jgi:hypothetical protein
VIKIIARADDAVPETLALIASSAEADKKNPESAEGW